jgi:hypothetical protein
MTKSILPLLLFFLSLATFGQNKIEGIGKFKLKKTTTSFLDTLSTEQNLEKIVIRANNEYFRIKNQDNILAEVKPDTLQPYSSPVYSHQCKDVRVFYLPNTKISDIDISEMYLTFYKDTLVDINIDYSHDIIDALTLKYGDPKLEKKENEVTCTLKLTGSEIKYKETMYYKKWENGNIKCTAAIGDYRDSKCERQTLSYISISIEATILKIQGCDEKEKTKIENDRISEKKKKLEDF